MAANHSNALTIKLVLLGCIVCISSCLLGGFITTFVGNQYWGYIWEQHPGPISPVEAQQLVLLQQVVRVGLGSISIGLPAALLTYLCLRAFLIHHFRDWLLATLAGTVVTTTAVFLSMQVIPYNLIFGIILMVASATVGGAVVGLAQWLVLRRLILRSRMWITMVASTWGVTVLITLGTYVVIMSGAD